MRRVNNWRRRLTACLLVLIAGCGYRYQGKSEYEGAQELDQVFKKAVQTAGGSAELQTIKKYGQEGQAWARWNWPQPLDLGYAFAMQRRS